MTKNSAALLISIIVLTIVTIVLNIVTGDDPFVYTWGLSLIPIFLSIILYPVWSIVTVTIVFFETVKYMLELYNYHGSIPSNDFIHLIYNSLLNIGAAMIFAYFRIKNHEMFQEIEKLTMEDNLTKVFNRRYFHLFMEKAIPLSSRTKRPLLLLLLDIDYFKEINDSNGHIVGDQVLIDLSKLIKESIRDEYAFVRIGGEEFAIVMPETSIEIGHRFAEQLRRTVAEKVFIYKKKEISITVSIGIGQYNGETIEQFIEKVDQSLYKAKENGRNQVNIAQAQIGRTEIKR